jgi:hypothetical protein
VLKPEGVLAAWAYKLAAVSPKIDAVVHHYYSEVVGSYWPEERRLVERFEELPFAFPEIDTPAFEMTARWSLEQLLGYLRTWSATQRFMAAERRDPLEDIADQLRAAWDAEEQRVVWPLTVRAARLP